MCNSDDTIYELHISDVIMTGGLNNQEFTEHATVTAKRFTGIGVLEKASALGNQSRFSNNLPGKPYSLTELAQRV